MLHINNNEQTTLYVTATERMTFTAVSVTLNLSRNNQDDDFVIDLGNDQSSYPDRYNQYTFNAVDFGFESKGDYQFNYKIVASDAEDNSETVEQGICYVHVLESTNIFTQHDTDNIFKQPN
jgi:hypothetical protein